MNRSGEPSAVNGLVYPADAFDPCEYEITCDAVRGFAFRVLPAVALALVYWRGDDEFAPEARVLFDAAAPHYLSTDGLAILGSHLVRQVLAHAHKGAVRS